MRRVNGTRSPSLRFDFHHHLKVQTSIYHSTGSQQRLSEFERRHRICNSTLSNFIHIQEGHLAGKEFIRWCYHFSSILESRRHLERGVDNYLDYLNQIPCIISLSNFTRGFQFYLHQILSTDAPCYVYRATRTKRGSQSDNMVPDTGFEQLKQTASCAQSRAQPLFSVTRL